MHIALAAGAEIDGDIVLLDEAIGGALPQRKYPALVAFALAVVAHVGVGCHLPPDLEAVPRRVEAANQEPIVGAEEGAAKTGRILKEDVDAGAYRCRRRK